MRGDAPGPRASTTCPNCGAALAGRWCHQCGQAALTPAQRGLVGLLGEFWTQLSSLESRWWRSLALLLARPGQLSADWLAGRRRRWLSPLSLFLLCNLLYFLVGGLSDFNLSLPDQACLQPYSSWIQPWIAAALSPLPLDCARLSDPAFLALSATYAGHATDVAKSLIVVHVPVLALPLWLANRSRPWFFAEHLGVALHLFAVLLLYTIVLLPVLLSWLPERASWLVLVAQMPLLAHWALALCRAYSWPIWRSAGMVVLVLAALLPAHFGYRALQFLVSWAVL